METIMRRRRGSLQREANGCWTARVTLCGRHICRTTGTRDLASAQRVLEQIILQLKCQCEQALSSVPLLGAWGQYEGSPDAARLASSTRRLKYRAWLHFAVWMRDRHPEIRDIRAVTRYVAEEYANFFQDSHAAMTCNLRICTLRGVFGVLLDGLGIEVNPWSCVHARCGGSHTRRELSLDEVRRLMIAAEGEGVEWLRLFAIAAYTGMRLGDCCRLRWDSVNLARRIIQFVPHKTRRYACGRPVTIPIHGRLLETLSEIPDDFRSGVVLPGIAADFAERRWAVSKALGRIFAAAGIETAIMLEGRRRRTPDASFHSLRHTFVSFAANAGVPLVVVQSIVGHTSTAMTRHYYHANETALRRAVDAVPSFGTDGYAAPGAVEPRRAGAATEGRHSLCARLRQVGNLLGRGLISAAEHEALRQRILADA